jgi:REP-associated tyrosine transposase
MVNHPARYTWSSYCANALGKDDRLVSPHAAFLALGLDPRTQRAAYTALCDEELEPSLLEAIRAATRGGYAMGSDPRRKSGV